MRKLSTRFSRNWAVRRAFARCWLYGFKKEVHRIGGLEQAMKFFHLLMLLLILRPCPACLANEVVAEIVTPQAVGTLSPHTIQDVCKCPRPHRRGHHHAPQQSPAQHSCPCCFTNIWAARVTSTFSLPRNGAEEGTLLGFQEVDSTQLTFRTIIETTRVALPNRDEISLPLLL
ncbi:hypothetical protein CA54_45280 [Symmachiella macrocystis]|uniref:Uncharacterized protein n=1 Tax=Symmachiella macrocystis TaxID=2527985 RepID=A0A5C6BBD1_9PLAN|nr:hypothetical protein CA54_45280 [Symmachiella macrocystis]